MSKRADRPLIGGQAYVWGRPGKYHRTRLRKADDAAKKVVAEVWLLCDERGHPILGSAGNRQFVTSVLGEVMDGFSSAFDLAKGRAVHELTKGKLTPLFCVSPFAEIFSTEIPTEVWEDGWTTVSYGGKQMTTQLGDNRLDSWNWIQGFPNLLEAREYRDHLLKRQPDQ